MSTVQMTETFRVARNPQGDRTPSARHLAWMMTAGAAAVSLLLGAALPARAADTDDLTMTLMTAPVSEDLFLTVNDSEGRVGAAALAELIKKKKRHQERAIPSVCAIKLDGQRRGGTFYSERCMRQEGVQARLPDHCARDARIWGKRDRVYGERCLREAGFKIEDRRRIY